MTESTPLVVCTGVSRGLGLEIALHALEKGYRVAGIARRLSDAYRSLMTEQPERAYFYASDLADVAQIPSLCEQITKTHGRVYGLVNNAALGHDGVLATMPNEVIQQLLKVNVEAPLLLAKYFSRGMLLARSGRIVNISSIIANTGFNGLVAYGASKAALEGMTRSLARELGKANITVNAVAPGYMATDMTAGISPTNLEKIKRRSPSGELASVDDVAATVMFLLSKQSLSINGSVMTIDAGATA